jgi:hypothetical protein
MKIAITFNGEINKLYCNGINYNVILWYDFLKECGHEPCFIYSHNTISNAGFTKFDLLGKEYCVIQYKLNNYPDLILFKEFLDIKMVFMIGLSHPSFIDFCKKINKKFICIFLGSVYYTDMQCILDKNYNGYCNLYQKYDEIWISPHFEFSKDYLSIRNNTLVTVCPYIWEPDLIDNDITKNNIQIIDNYDKINVGIMEPNLNYVKTCLIPLALCEDNIDDINMVYLFNSEDLPKIKFFTNFIDNLKIKKLNKIKIAARYSIVNILSKWCNCIVSCVENCELNYVFLECFYLGVPLIHNSSMLKEYGYYYPNLDIHKAKDFFKEIKQSFNREEYINKHKPLLHKYSMYNSINKEWVNKRINSIIDNK